MKTTAASAADRALSRGSARTTPAQAHRLDPPAPSQGQKPRHRQGLAAAEGWARFPKGQHRPNEPATAERPCRRTERTRDLPPQSASVGALAKHRSKNPRPCANPPTKKSSPS